MVLSAARVGLLGKALEVPGSESAIERALARESDSTAIWLAWAALLRSGAEVDRWLDRAHSLGAPAEVLVALELRSLALKGEFVRVCSEVGRASPEVEQWLWASFVGLEQAKASCAERAQGPTAGTWPPSGQGFAASDFSRHVLSLPRAALEQVADEAWSRGELGWSLVLADRWVAESGTSVAACWGRAKALALGDVVRSTAWDALCRSPHEAQLGGSAVLSIEGPGDLAAAWEAARQGDLERARVLVLAVPPAPDDPRTLLIQRSWTWVEGK